MDAYFARLDSIFPEGTQEDEPSFGSLPSGSLPSSSTPSGSGSTGSDSIGQIAGLEPSQAGPILRRRSTQDRSDDEDDEAVEATHKKLKAYARGASTREGLPANSLEWFAVVSASCLRA